MFRAGTTILWWKWFASRMKLRAYLVDDEPLALDRLRRLLEHTGRVDVIGSTIEPEIAVADLTAIPPMSVSWIFKCPASPVSKSWRDCPSSPS